MAVRTTPAGACVNITLPQTAYLVYDCCEPMPTNTLNMTNVFEGPVSTYTHNFSFRFFLLSYSSSPLSLLSIRRQDATKQILLAQMNVGRLHFHQIQDCIMVDTVKGESSLPLEHTHTNGKTCSTIQ